MKIKDIKLNLDNPRIIKDERFKKLVKSLKEFPKMLALRPIIINEDNMVLGGNMRLKALKELGYKEIPDSWVKRVDKLTEDEKRRFIVADNVEFGENDFEMLSKEWDKTEITDWGLESFETNESKIDFFIEDKEITGFKKTHILFSFPPELFIEIQDYIQKIKDVKGVEYEQSNN